MYAQIVVRTVLTALGEFLRLPEKRASHAGPALSLKEECHANDQKL